mmetsp:Transcript_2648/g.7972  ORF Transcript_2648/g.7972 Transcript_2648/m.7972 type:complete len:220 (-) Transcript_2648:1248-1907(-)
MDSATLARSAMGDKKQGSDCIERMVLIRTVEGVVRAFKEVLSPWGFDVLPVRPRWGGGREMSSEDEEEMLVRAISVAHDEQIRALWDIWKCLHAWGLHVAPRRQWVYPEEEERAAHRLTTDRKVHIIRDALRQLRHSASHLGEPSREHIVHIARIPGSLAHASRLGPLLRASEHDIVSESIRRLQRAATMLPEDVDIDGEVLICAPHLDRIARCLRGEK